MKKLLAMFSSFALLSTPAISIVSCSNTDTQHKDGNGDSIWAWLPGIANGKKVTSPSVWDELSNPLSPADSWDTNPNNWDGPTKTKMAVQLIDLLAVAILASGSKDNPNPKPNFSTKIPGFNTLFTGILNDDAWTQFVAKAKNTYQNKVNTFKTSNPKNWEKDFNKYLDSNYPDIYGYTGNKKYEIEKQNFMAAIMTSGVEGGTSALNFIMQSLVTNNQTPYLYDTNFINIAQIYYSIVNDAIKSGNEASDIFSKIKDELEKKGYDSSNATAATAIVDVFFNTIFNSVKTDYTDFQNLTISKILTDLKNKYTSGLPPITQLNYVPIFSSLNNIKDIEKDTIGLPDINKNYSPSGGTSNNPNELPNYQLSMFQSYFYEQWYQDKKPLALSSVVIPFKSDSKPFSDSEGINSNVFDSGQKTNIYSLATNLGTNAQSWLDQLMNGSQYPGATVGTTKELLTLDSTDASVSSNILKYVLYSASQDIAAANSTNDNTIPDLQTVIENNDSNKTTENITKLITRIKSDNNQTFYRIYKWKDSKTSSQDYIVTFFDEKGLNFVHIDGNQYLSTANQNWDKETLNKLNSKDEYNALTENIQFTTNYQSLPEYNSSDQSKWLLNKQFNNAPYLYYLINQGTVNKNNTALSLPSTFTFDPQTNFTAYVKNSSTGTDGTWWYWLYSFMNFIYSDVADTPTENWLNSFISFKNSSSSSEKISPDDGDYWFIEAMNTAKTTLQGEPINKLIENYTKENSDTIAKYPTNDASPNRPIPGLADMYSTVYGWGNWHSFNNNPKVNSKKIAIQSFMSKIPNQTNFYEQVQLWAYYKEEKGNN